MRVCLDPPLLALPLASTFAGLGLDRCVLCSTCKVTVPVGLHQLQRTLNPKPEAAARNVKDVENSPRLGVAPGSKPEEPTEAHSPPPPSSPHQFKSSRSQFLCVQKALIRKPQTQRTTANPKNPSCESRPRQPTSPNSMGV